MVPNEEPQSNNQPINQKPELTQLDLTIQRLGFDINDVRIIALISAIREDAANNYASTVVDMSRSAYELRRIAEREQNDIVRSQRQLEELRSSTERLLKEIEVQKQFAENIMIKESAKSRVLSLGFFGALAAVLGFAAVTSNLIAGFPDFIRAIERFISGKNYGLLEFIGTAYAETIPQAAAAATSGPIAPIFVYAVYVLLSLAYVVTLFFIFFAKDDKDKGNALDLFKNLNAFFIGSITGKFV